MANGLRHLDSMRVPETKPDAETEGLPVVLVIAKDPLVAQAWQAILSTGYTVTHIGSADAALQHLTGHTADVTIVGFPAPAGDSLQLLRALHDAHPSMATIAALDGENAATATAALNAGAFDHVSRPFASPAAIRECLAGAVSHTRSLRRQLLSNTAGGQNPLDLIAGQSVAIAEVKKLIRTLASTASSVLICGESGTGKELVARSLHETGDRRNKPFVAVNCAATTATLIESELFGHERGAFTGATRRHRGLFESADGGVLFLDEIGDMPADTQVRLLRTLQDGEVRPVGANTTRKINVRVIAATNANLEEAIEQRRFREDLFYRISTFRIILPPLRERPADLMLLAHLFLKKACAHTQKDISGFASDAVKILKAYSWPGNVRELGNAVEHAATLGLGPLITPSDLPPSVTGGNRRSHRAFLDPDMWAAQGSCYAEARKQVLREFDLRFLSTLLQNTKGNLSEAARQAGIDRSNLRRMIRRHGISIDAYRPDV